ncbi:hypothetical protein V499_01540 [Pseudogymnoascus sp. VKM F-103]|nr:hypothetical protein V499_01540 [Pseudogymnoascus sp. VKM F-103]
MRASSMPIALLGAVPVFSIDLPTGSDAPFLKIVNDKTCIIGNSVWDATLSGSYARPIYYNGKDIVDDATGFYLSYVNNNGFPWLAPEIVDAGNDWIDVQFTNDIARFHWVIHRGLAGAYQYWSNQRDFHSGHTYRKDGKLPTWDLYYSGTEVQDSTVQFSDGTYVSKYDWATHINIPEAKLWGVYGDDVGCWFIQPSQEYLNGDQLKQELTVHMEAQTGDTALLNMIGGGHYQLGVDRTMALSRAGSVTGRIITSDSRAGDTLSVFLGDNNDGESTLNQYAGYHYRTTTDSKGYFTFDNVRTGEYGLFAWPGEGSSLGDITTNFTHFDIAITKKDKIDLGTYTWEVQNRTKIWQIGTLDRLPCEFAGGCGPYGHALTDDAPADLTYTIGSSKAEYWHYVLSNNGAWAINFKLNNEPVVGASARLTVSLAAYAARCYMDAARCYMDIMANGVVIGHIRSMASDSAIYRSSTVAGVWRFLEYTIKPGTLKKCSNSIKFTTTTTEKWKGAMWDNILLEWE